MHCAASFTLTDYTSPCKPKALSPAKALGWTLTIGDENAIRKGCDWINQYKQLNPARRLVYRCIENLMGLENIDNFRRSLDLLCDAETVRQAEALLNRSERLFRLDAGCGYGRQCDAPDLAGGV